MIPIKDDYQQESVERGFEAQAEESITRETA